MKMILVSRSSRPLGALAATTAALFLAAACGTGSEVAQPAADEPDQVNVVVAFYPFQFVAERVGGSRTRVQNLTEPGSEPHDVELTAKQVASLSEADLVIFEETFQPAVDQAVEQSGQQNTLDTATVVPLQPVAAEEHADEEHAESDEHAGLDPHVWLDPHNLVAITTAVADRLGAVDPDHRATYAANADALIGDLNNLDAAFRDGLASCQRSEFITSHDAFGYLARRYRLTQIAIAGLSPDAEPSPARIAEVQREAKEHGVTTIFYETLVSPAVAEAIAGDLGLKVDVLDPVEGLNEQSKGNSYLSVMEANLKALTAANGCT